MKTYELPVVNGSRKSFYGKAVVCEDENGKHLLSYGKNICTIDKDENVEVHTDIPMWNSQTSMRHLKSFLAFNNIDDFNFKTLQRESKDAIEFDDLDIER